MKGMEKTHLERWKTTTKWTYRYLKLTANAAPENRPFNAPKGNEKVFQLSIFRCELLVSGRVNMILYELHRKSKLQARYHQEFQVPKMEVLNLIRLFLGWVFLYISRINTAYTGEYSSILGTWKVWWRYPSFKLNPTFQFWRFDCEGLLPWPNAV